MWRTGLAGLSCRRTLTLPPPGSPTSTGKERYIARYIARCTHARDAGLAYDQVARAINASSSNTRPRPLNFPDTVPSDPAIDARAAQILLLLAPDAADSLGSEGSCCLEEEVEQPQQPAAA